MVSKCANTLCSASFRYLHSGKLFRFDARHSPDVADAAVGKARKSVELFWLCEECTRRFTVVWDPAEGARAIALIDQSLRPAS